MFTSCGKYSVVETLVRTVDLIRIKRDGGTLTAEQIQRLIAGYVAGEIPDYQIAAWAMAVYFNGMNSDELAALTQAMLNSGEVYDLSEIPGPTADKHSTGGVGDKVSLILAPVAAACGLYVPMVSGRGLGHTGGTLDKLESIPGFTTKLSRTRFVRQLKKVGIAMGGQTEKFVPADRLLYALRDVTATVESIPLISASIMSKKLAEGAQSLVLDVKTGNGAFMSKASDALKLAQTLVAIGRSMGRNVSALLTDMNQTLGRAVGNANEVAESIECLKGRGPADLMEVTLALTGRMLTLSGLAKDDANAKAMMQKSIETGAALEKFRQMVEAQGGDPKIADNSKLLPAAPKKRVVGAHDEGYLSEFKTRDIGTAAMLLGAGRAVKTDKIDPAVGIIVRARIGDKVERGQPIYEVHYGDESNLDQAVAMLKQSFALESAPVKPPCLIHRSVD